MTIAMARTNEPHSGDSQFYVNLVDNAALDPKPTRWGYAVFGRVIEGADIVDAIGHRATESRGQFPNMPAVPVIIEEMVLISDSSR
jgi:cyclophilin family peptidyl-prolyl cis-trans isomerase